MSRLESAVAKSQYVGQGKKLKVTNKVRLLSIGISFILAPTSELENQTLEITIFDVAYANLCFQVNSDIIGGLVVEIGDRTIDLSVSSRIAKMNKLLTDSL